MPTMATMAARMSLTTGLGCAPVDFAAMRNAQDQNPQGFILDPHHDAPVADPIAPEWHDPGAAHGASQRCTETARIVHVPESLAQKPRDTPRNLVVERVKILQGAGVKLNPPGQARAPPPRVCSSATGRLGCR